MIVSKKSSIEAMLDLEDFLHARLVKPIRVSTMVAGDMIKARDYYQALNKMRDNARSIGAFSYFPAIENGNQLIDRKGNTLPEIVTFSDIKDFCKYISKEYLL